MLYNEDGVSLSAITNACSNINAQAGCYLDNAVYVDNSGKYCSGWTIRDIYDKYDGLSAAGGLSSVPLSNMELSIDKKYLEKITECVKKELTKVDLYDGPEIPKWTGFINI